MTPLQNKIDFAVIFSVRGANPNGDPLNGNRPRDDSAGYGEVSDVCIKRKLRNRLRDMGESVFVQSGDGCDSLRARLKSCEELKKLSSGKNADLRLFVQAACARWIDVRSFGQVFAFGGECDSVFVRGPVTIGIAKSVSPVNIITVQSKGGAYGKGGTEYGDMSEISRVDFGLYVFNGSINCPLAEKTGFTEEDAEKIKWALITLFDNDSSFARPEGSMRVCRVYWWRHSARTPAASSARVQRSLRIAEKAGLCHKPCSFEDYDIITDSIGGISPPEVFAGM